MSIVVYLVRHGEVEHHRTDVSVTPRGQAQAEAAGAALASRIADGDAVSIHHSPVIRVRETAELLRDGLVSALAAGRTDRVAISPLHLDPSLCNVRFILGPGQEPEEPSLLYETINTPAYIESASPARAEFYRGFWSSRDPMGYWLTHDSAGAAETPEFVLARMKERLRSLFHETSILSGMRKSAMKSNDTFSTREPPSTSTSPFDFAQGRSVSAQGARSAENVEQLQKTTGRLHWIGVTHSGAMRGVLRAAFGDDPGEPDFCEVIVVEPSGHADRAALSYRGRSALLDIAYR